MGQLSWVTYQEAEGDLTTGQKERRSDHRTESSIMQWQNVSAGTMGYAAGFETGRRGPSPRNAKTTAFDAGAGKETLSPSASRGCGPVDTLMLAQWNWFPIPGLQASRTVRIMIHPYCFKAHTCYSSHGSWYSLWQQPHWYGTPQISEGLILLLPRKHIWQISWTLFSGADTPTCVQHQLITECFVKDTHVWKGC